MFPRSALAAAFLSLGLAACGQPSNSTSAGGNVATVAIDGSSTVFPLSEAIAEAFTTQTRGAIRATVGESGTGGGFRKFCRGEIEIQGASRPILTNEMEACAAAGISYVEIPIAFDGLTVVVHPSNPITSATIADLKAVWEPAAERTITNWRHANNAWPDLGLQLYGAGTASGTFDYFTEAVVGTAKASRTDYTPTEDDNVTVQGVASNPGAMGYFGFAYYEQNRQRVRALAIDGGAGPIEPTPESIANGSYPLARPLFIYVSANALRRPAVQRMAQYFVANAARLAPEVGYVPLPETAYATLGQRLRDGTTGTAFGGHQEVGSSIEEVLQRPLAAAPVRP